MRVGTLELGRAGGWSMQASSRRAVTRIALLALALAWALAAIALLGFSGGAPAGGIAAQDAQTFLAGYVQPSGRVVRRDQGGDTVSEGQAYALLLAQAVGDEATFARVWGWTRAHLQRPDGLLSYLAARSGAVRDTTPAADADVLTAWSLARATGRGAAGYHAAARRMANAILSHETARRGTLLMLAAGPWATGAPVTLDPSYWAPEAFSALGRFTGDGRWQALVRSSLALTGSLTGAGATLPPDWARVDGTTATATPAPDGRQSRVRYGLDAQRLVVWLGASCDPAARRLAARWASKLPLGARSRALALAPSGSLIDTSTNALPLVAAAGAAAAAGEPVRRDRLLDEAGRVEAAHPTYYGAAWLALGRTLLSTSALGGCANGRAGS
jgi:endoglucanase